MANNLDTKTIFNGSDGAIWITTDTEEVKVGSMKTFSLKQTNVWGDVDLSQDLIKKRKLLGVELTGEFTKYKVDNTFINIFKQYKDGEQPDITIVGKAYNNSTGKVQRVRIEGITFDELVLVDLQQKTVIEESLPFAAENYEWIENN